LSESWSEFSIGVQFKRPRRDDESVILIPPTKELKKEVSPYEQESASSPTAILLHGLGCRKRR
jgi:hypothetical protein